MIKDFKGVMPKIGKKVYCAERAVVIGDVTINDYGNIWFNTVLRGDVSPIVIGASTNVQDNSTVHTSAGCPTNIGANVTIGHNCIIHGCTIEDECLIGMGSVVLDGAVIGKNSIVGAGSLVTKNKTFPEKSLIIGSPAKVIRTLTEQEIEGIRNSSKHYVENALCYMDGSEA